MRKHFLLFTSLLTTFLIYAQQRTGSQQMNGRFYGKVVEAKSNKGIEAVSVQLLQNKLDTASKTRKDVMIGGMLTTAHGDFSIENVPMFGKYKLKISAIGFTDFELPVAFDIGNARGGDMNAMINMVDKDLGNIKLQIDEKILGTVTVTASKPLFQLGIDRKIFNGTCT